MQPGILITTPYGIVGIYLLLRMLLENKYRVICLADPLETGLPGGLFDMLKKAAEISGYTQSELLKAQQALLIIPVDLISPDFSGLSHDDLKPLKNLQIHSIWHCMEYNPWQNVSLNINTSKFNEIIMKNTLQIAKLLHIQAINVIHTGYIAESLFQEIVMSRESFWEGYRAYQTDKRTAESILLEDGLISVRVFRTPEVIGYSKSPELIFNSSLQCFLSSLNDFINWLYERLTDYYNRYAFNLYQGACNIVNISFVDTLVEKILSVTETDFHCQRNAPKVIHLYNSNPIFMDKFVTILKKSFPGIEIKITNNIRTLNYFDRMFLAMSGAIHFSFFNQYQNYLPGDLPIEAKDYEDKLPEYFEGFIKMISQAKANRLALIDTFFHKGIKKTIRCRFGSELIYYIFGDGPALVMINAIGVKIEAFKEIIYYLSKSYRIITWECRGLFNVKAYSNDPGFVFSFEEQANDLKEILLNEGINQAHLAGWCSGALIALAFYRNEPLMTKSLTLISGTYVTLEGRDLNWVEDMREISTVLKKEPRLARMYMRMTDRLLFEIKNIGEFEDNLEKVLEKVAPKYRTLFNTPYIQEEYLINFCKIIGTGISFDIKKTLKEIKIPVYVIAAENDQIVSVKQFNWVKNNIKQAKSLCIPGATHWFLTENGKAAAITLNAFWNLS
jgi:pimeloyl-ACP methyl ester carboxylesterase